MTDKQREIVTCWDKWDSDEPDISTEQLMARVCADCKCDPDAVCDAMEAEKVGNDHR